MDNQNNDRFDVYAAYRHFLKNEEVSQLGSLTIVVRPLNVWQDIDTSSSHPCVDRVDSKVQRSVIRVGDALEGPDHHIASRNDV
jgi:hypothetical protein